MQNVYLVVSDDYEERLTWGVFSSEERAQEAINQIKERYSDYRPFDLSVVDMSLDEIDTPF